MDKYAELQVTTNFSFLRGGSHPEEMAEQAATLGYEAIAVTDRNSLAGIVRAHIVIKKLNDKKGEYEPKVKFIPACRLDLLDGPSLLAYPTNRDAYGRLSALLTVGNLRAEKGECNLYKADVYQHQQDIIFIIIPPDALNPKFDFDEDFKAAVAEYREHLSSPLYIAAIRSYSGDDAKRLFRIAQLGIPMVATGDVHYHEPNRRELQDILTCIREKCTIHNAGFRLHGNAERYLKPIDEQHRLFRDYPEAIKNALTIAEACNFSLDTLKYIEPEEAVINGETPMQRLTRFTWEGANKRYDNNVPDEVKKQVEFELAFLEKRKLAPYFLRVHKYTRKAEELGILYQGRGSAANSTVCYCLAITAVNPMESRLLFSRFMSDARDEWPDIDVDFEHERREEIIQYIYEDYGRERAAIVATVTQQRHRGAIRDAGKAMGLSEDTIKRIGATIWDFSEEGFDETRLREQGLNPHDPVINKVLELTTLLMGFPRQLGQHTGGFVITDGLLSDLCPVMNARMENRTQLEWNKDDLEALGILKVDVLGLGMLTMIRKAFNLTKQHYGLDLTLANIKQGDKKVYEMISHADTVGVFQIESRAQMSMLPRLRPACFYDLVIEVAIVRPGPIQGDMVHPYLRRRDEIEKEEYPQEELRPILSRTKGVPLFQEQAMEIAMVAAEFTAAEADELRRSMATFKAKGLVSSFRKKLVDGMVRRGYEEEFAGRIFKQLEGFGSYGFPESHAASFALLVYISSWLKCYYPDVFCAALLNSQPMGFYQPAQIVIDAQNHGVTVLEVDVNHSAWDNAIQSPGVVRLGFRQVKGLREEDMADLIAARLTPYTRPDQIPVKLAALEKLADADAFRSMGLDRRKALWQVSALADKPVALFKGKPEHETQVQLPLMTQGEHVVQDYASTGLSLKSHPVALVRNQLELLHVMPISKMKTLTDGDTVKIAGLITVRQRPGTAKGMLFMTLEDETGNANLVVWEKLFDTYRKEIIQSRLFMAEGKVQIEGEVIHVVMRRCFNLSGLLRGLTATQNDDFPVSAVVITVPKPNTEETPEGIFHKGRNFR